MLAWVDRKDSFHSSFVGSQTNHEESDNIGENILGKQPGHLYKDDAASAINNLRTQVLMQKSDIVIALFGEQFGHVIWLLLF